MQLHTASWCVGGVSDGTRAQALVPDTPSRSRCSRGALSYGACLLGRVLSPWDCSLERDVALFVG